MLPCCIRESVSNENVEKVVNPPRNPTNIAKRSSSGALSLSTSVYDKKPIISEPVTLTNKVPYGKLLPNQFTECV